MATQYGSSGLLWKKARDWARYRPLNNMFRGIESFGEAGCSVKERIQNEWGGVSYKIQNIEYPWTEPFWKLLLTGIEVPSSPNLIVNVAYEDVITPMIRHLGISARPEVPSEGCYYRTRRGSRLPSLHVEDVSDGNRKARKIIDCFVQYRDGIQHAFSEIDKTYPTTFEEIEALMPKFIDEFGLDFLRKEAELAV